MTTDTLENMPTAPLLVTCDEDLLDEVLRLSAASGASPEVVTSAAGARSSWPLAPLVLVGHDLAGEVAADSPERRPSTYVVCRDPAPDQLFRDALGLGAEHVVELPTAEAWLVDRLSDAVDGPGQEGDVVAVLGGSGGAGASVFAAALATVLARAGPTLVVDADEYGAGLDRILGLDEEEGIGWDALHRTSGRLGARAFRDALPSRDRLAVLTWRGERSEVQPFAVREALSAGRRAFAWVVVDVSRHPDPAGEEVLARCEHVVLVSGVRVSSVAASGRVVARIRESPARKHLVTRGRGGVHPEEVGHVLRMPLVAMMGDQRGLDESLDLGVGPVRARRGALARAAEDVIACLEPVARRPGRAP